MYIAQLVTQMNGMRWNLLLGGPPCVGVLNPLKSVNAVCDRKLPLKMETD